MTVTKPRMRTLYRINGFTGDCSKWAAEARRMGQDVVTERVLWLGPAWTCPACALGRH